MVFALQGSVASGEEPVLIVSFQLYQFVVKP
jgi:hypothetical protein